MDNSCCRNVECGISTHAWIGKNIFETNEVGLEFPVNNPGAPVRLSDDYVYVVPSPEKLVIRPRDLADSYSKRAKKIACKLLETLPHTPISAPQWTWRKKQRKQQWLALTDDFERCSCASG